MRRVLALAIVVALPALAARPPLTIERIFSSPPLDGSLPREVHWLPDGMRFSFLAAAGEDGHGHSTLWIEDAASAARTEVFAEADLVPAGRGGGVAAPKLAGYRWSPGGDALLLEGGGDLFLVDVATKAVRQLTKTSAKEEVAEFSPDGKWVSFVRNNDLFALELATGREIRLSHDGDANHLNGKLDWVYEEEIAGRKPVGYAWSPDSCLVAFITLDETRVPRYPLVDALVAHPVPVEQQYPLPGDPLPRVGLAIVSVGRDPSGRPVRRHEEFGRGDATYLPRFGWTPDSSAVWYELLDRAQTRLALEREEVRSGRTATLLVETDPAWINLHDEQHFFPDGRFLWWSERSGFGHLYLGDSAGTLKPITSGEWEVTSVPYVDEAHGTVEFVATKTSPLERQLYRAQLDGSHLERITKEDGTHVVAIAPAGGFILDTWSRELQPPVMRVLDPNGKVLRAVVPVSEPSLDAPAFASIEFIMLKAADGTTLRASLLKPADFDPHRRYPVVVYVYGGPHEQVVKDAWGGRNALFHLYLASKGFLVFSLDNRGSAARGRAFERVLLRRFGKVELEDQLAGVAYLRALPYVDPARVGIWGWSYGGFMTCYALTNAPGVFAAGAAVAPVTDWRLYDAIYTERYLKLPADNPAGYRDSSPIEQAEKLASPLLLIHGTGDDNVHWSNTLELIDRLYKAGKSYDLQVYPNLKHPIDSPAARVHLYTRIAEHFIRYLHP
jgi:dipeptidyl-peptidase-4